MLPRRLAAVAVLLLSVASAHLLDDVHAILSAEVTVEADAAVEPVNPAFVCDGARQLAAVAVNDDYCDCDDGSDELLTSACGHTSVKVRPVNLAHVCACF
jgi:hypothetical protein